MRPVLHRGDYLYLTEGLEPDTIGIFVTNRKVCLADEFKLFAENAERYGSGLLVSPGARFAHYLLSRGAVREVDVTEVSIEAIEREAKNPGGSLPTFAASKK